MDFDDIDLPTLSANRAPGWVSDALALAIRALDLPYIALTPGASYRGLHDSLVNFLGNRAPQMLVCLHEEHAVAIAHGYAKVTGKPIGALLHSNVGLLHAAMAIFNAFCDRMPVIVLGAHGPVDAAKRRPWIDWVHTSADAAAPIRNFVKWDNQPGSAPAAVEALYRAGMIARTAPKGPVYVCFDSAMQEEPHDGPFAPPDPARFRPPAAAEPSGEATKAAAALLAAAKRPLILAGRIAPDAAAWARRVALAERLGATVMSDWRVGATFPTDHALHAGAPQFFVAPWAREIIQQADVILSLDWVDLGGTLKAACGDTPVAAKIVHASCDVYAHNGWSMDHQALAPVDVALLSTPERAVEALLAALRPSLAGVPPPAPRPPQSTRPRSAAEGRVPMALVASTLRDALGDQAATLTRLPIGWPSGVWPFRHPLDFLGSDGGAGVGSGPGLAVGAALALRGSGRMTVAILGDGDYLMGVTAFWTAARHRIPLLVVVANNQSFLNDELHQERVARDRSRPAENRWIGQRLDDPAPDIAGLARAQGLSGFGPVRTEAELTSALGEALAVVRAGGAAVVDVHVPQTYEENSRGG